MQSTSNETQELITFQGSWLFLRRRWLPLVTVATLVFGVTAVATFLKKPVYEAQGKVLLSKKDRVYSLTDLTDQAREITSLTETTNPVDTEAEIIQSIPLADQTIATLNLKDSTGQPLDSEQFLKQLKVKGIRGTDVLAVSYRGKNPQEVAGVVNSLIQHYLENNVQVNRSETIAAREFIRKELPEVERRVAIAEEALRRFKESNHVVALDEEAKVSVQALSDLSDQITKAKADLVDATSRIAVFQRQIGLSSPQAIALTTLSQSKEVQQSLADYRQVQDQLAVERTIYQPGHPIIINLEEKEAALKNQLELRIVQALGSTQPVPDQNLQFSTLKQNLTEDLLKAEAERLALANRVSVLTAAMANYETRTNMLPQLEQNQQEIERRVQVARSTYEQLLKRLQEVELAENQNVGNARVVSPAIAPKKAIAPRIPLNLAFGALTGILIGILAAIVLDELDKPVKTVEEVPGDRPHRSSRMLPESDRS
jgi:uncharacterized protein involved in exopolysaccharide biosynthesis